MSDGDGLTIKLDYAPAYFLPGDPVTGRLIVTTTSETGVSTKGLSITFHGEIHTAWSEQHQDHFRHNDYGNTISEYRTHWYVAHENLFNFPLVLLAGTHELPHGDTVFPFSFHLPPDIPSSDWYYYGHVEYSLRACLQRSWAKDWKTERVIPVLALLDLRSLPQFNQPTEFYAEKEFGCCFCKSDPLRLWCDLEKTGFYPGELIKFLVTVDNQSDREIQALTAELKQNFTVTADGHQRWRSNEIAEISIEMNSQNPTSGEDFWRGELLVPVCAPSGLGANAHVLKLVKMNYTLNIIAKVDGCCKSNPTVLCDVAIGSLPPGEMQSSVPQKIGKLELDS